MKLEPVEPNIGSYNPSIPFVFNQNGCCVHEIFRILTGSANIKIPGSEKIILLRENVYGASAWKSSDPSNIFNLLFSDSISLDEYKFLVTTLSLRENSFFIKLRDELILCLVNKKNKRYTESFLYIYRILELISVAFPMIYAITQEGFRKSHDFLKSLITNEKDGDLSILDKAIPALSKEGELENLVFDFSIAGLDIEFVANLRRQLNDCIKPSVKNMYFDDDGDILFHVPFNDMVKFIVNMRNRMFHYRIREKNIDLGSIGGADNICKIIIDEIIKWFSLVFSEIIRVLSRRYV